jgi:hypothetical protein
VQPRAVTIAVSDRSIAHTRRRLIEIRSKLRRPPAAEPFLVVTPLGLKAKRAMVNLLAGRAIQIKARKPLPDWPAVSTLLYVRRTDRPRIVKALCYESIWSRLFRIRTAEIWLLRDYGDYRRLVRDKRDLRDRMDSVCLSAHARTRGESQSIRINLHPFHAPDAKHLTREAAILNLMVSCAGAAQLPVCR